MATSGAAAQQRKAILLEARLRGVTGKEASSAFGTPFDQNILGDHSLQAPITELGFGDRSNSRGGRSNELPGGKPGGPTSMGGIASTLAGGDGRLAPGAPAPRLSGGGEPAPKKMKRSLDTPDGKAAAGGKKPPPPSGGTSAKRKASAPQRIDKALGATVGGRAAAARGDDDELRALRDRVAAAEAEARAATAAARASDKKVSELSAELKRCRDDRDRDDARATRRASGLRAALEATLREGAVAEAREKRRAVGAAAFELGRAVYASGAGGGFGGGRDSWEEGDAEKRLRRRAAAILQRREALDAAKRARAKAKKREPDGGAAFDVDGAAEDEAHRFHASQLKRDEAELAGERAAIERRKQQHVREWQRVRHEDASRFAPRPTMNDRYLLLSLLGKGGFSEVWLAYDLNEARRVAIKFHQLDHGWSDEKKSAYVRHAAREYAIQRDLDHPRVVRLHDVFEVDTNTFATVLEHCGGEDLDSLLRSRKHLPERDARAILLQVLAGLRHLQTPSGPRKAIIHYDLKPGNILFDDAGDAKITDFGLSKIVTDDDASSRGGPTLSMELTSQGAGTYWYLPPECFATDVAGGPRISGKVDVWSAGVIYFQMLFGRKPFGEGLSQQRLLADRTMARATSVDFPAKPAVSADAKDFLRDCLRHSAAERPSVADLCAHAYVTKAL